MVKCSRCGGTDSARDDARGETVCTTCGAVLTEGAMVDSLAFHSGGQMTGQFIDKNTGQARGFPGRFAMRESREVSLARGFTNLDRVAYKLHLAQPIVEASKRLYTSAFSRNFTQGRPGIYVASACLYAVCRKQSSAHMLIDFSDALRTPVKTLAQTFMKLIRALTLSVPTVDPSLFMERFAGDMNLGEITGQVAQTGVRIVQAMKRDWICTGRRPLGLCAASLLIAARYHGRKVNADDIDEVFRMSSGTIEKRVFEFGQTAAAQLRIKDFETVDIETLPILNGPPCMRRKRSRLALEDGDADTPLHRPIEDRSAPKPIEDDPEPEIPTQASASEGLAGTIELQVKPKQLCSTDLSAADVASVAGKMVTAIGKAAENIDAQQAAEAESLPHVLTGVAKAAPEIAQMVLELGGDDTPATNVGDDTPAGGGYVTPAGGGYDIPESAAIMEYDEEGLDEIEDDEVDAYFLSPEEQEEKALIWDELNKGVMPLVYERLRQKREREGRSGALKVRRKKEPLGPADDPKASVMAALGLADRKLNVDVLESLF